MQKLTDDRCLRRPRLHRHTRYPWPVSSTSTRWQSLHGGRNNVSKLQFGSLNLGPLAALACGAPLSNICYRGQSGKHLLIPRFTDFDPKGDMATKTLAKTGTHLDGIVRRDAVMVSTAPSACAPGGRPKRTAPCAEARWSADHDRARSQRDRTYRNSHGYYDTDNEFARSQP